MRTNYKISQKWNGADFIIDMERIEPKAPCLFKSKAIDVQTAMPRSYAARLHSFFTPTMKMGGLDRAAATERRFLP